MPTPRKTKPAKAKSPGIGDRNRARILGAAVEIFVCKGFDGARIAEIAQRSGLPKANVYYYFRNKQAIYETIIANLAAEWDDALSHLDAARDPGDALASYIQAKLDFSRNRTAQSKMFANEVVHGGRFLSRAVLRHMNAVTREKAKVFEGLGGSRTHGSSRADPSFHPSLEIDAVLRGLQRDSEKRAGRPPP
jgi:AcrR family transcriptional regulator